MFHIFYRQTGTWILLVSISPQRSRKEGEPEQVTSLPMRFVTLISRQVGFGRIARQFRVRLI